MKLSQDYAIEEHYNNLRAAANNLPDDVKARLDANAYIILKEYQRLPLTESEQEYLNAVFDNDTERYYSFNLSPTVAEFLLREKNARIAKRAKDGFLDVKVALGMHYGCGEPARDKFEHKHYCANCNVDCDAERIECFDLDSDCTVAAGFKNRIEKDYYMKCEFHISSILKKPESYRMMIDLNRIKKLDKPAFREFFRAYEKTKWPRISKFLSRWK